MALPMIMKKNETFMNYHAPINNIPVQNLRAFLMSLQNSNSSGSVVVVNKIEINDIVPIVIILHCNKLRIFGSP